MQVCSSQHFEQDGNMGHGCCCIHCEGERFHAHAEALSAAFYFVQAIFLKFTISSPILSIILNFTIQTVLNSVINSSVSQGTEHFHTGQLARCPSEVPIRRLFMAASIYSNFFRDIWDFYFGQTCDNIDFTILFVIVYTGKDRRSGTPLSLTLKVLI